uniref:Acyl-coenzyme A thioesterase 1-like n=1 Tax=Salarias fasciatus TaxID=181472 RepID=A0A672JU32_SALFA
MMRLQLWPRARCLFDEPVQVKVAGLRSNQVVTMKARSTDERGRLFKSSAIYRADETGEVDLNRDPSLSGSYIGVEPMGLLWSLSPEILHKLFTKTKALIPHVVKISVYEEGEEGQMLAEVTNERFLIADGVSRVPVSEGNIRGVLFTPPGEGPFPAVLDLCTFVSETRACLLANKGFVVLTVAMFNDKPRDIKEFHLDLYQEAIDYLLKQPKVSFKGVGVLSRSKGGDVALALAAFVPGIEAIVWINGCSGSSVYPLFYKKHQILSQLSLDISKAIPTESGASIIKHVIEDPLAEKNKGSLVPVQKVKGRLLFVASGDDLNWDSKGYMDEMVERLKRHGKNNFESVYYPLAGHLLEPPYYPFCPSSFHIMTPFPVLWGGEPKAHIAAEVDLWEKIQEFFKTHLSCDPAKSTANL